MADLFRNSSSSALTREQAVELEKKRLAERSRQMRQARELAAQGRGEDTEMAHVALGEIVLPKALQTSDVLNAIRQAAQDANIPFNQLRIGSTSNSINPETGMPEFGLFSGIGDWFSKTFGAGTANAAPGSTSPFIPATASNEGGTPDQAPMEEIVVTGRAPTTPPTVLDKQRRFFETFSPAAERMAGNYGLDPNHVLGLAAFESKWFEDPEAIRNNNPFGVNSPGTKQLRSFNSLDDAFDYWGKVFGSRLGNTPTTDNFVDGLRHSVRAGAYNSAREGYDSDLRDTIDSVRIKRPIWQQGR